MKVPKNFKTRIAGNFYENTPNIIVCRDERLLRIDRDDATGQLDVELLVFDSRGRRQALINGTNVTHGNSRDFKIQSTDHSYVVRERGTGRNICEIRRSLASRGMGVDVFLLTHSPDGFFIHVNPVQSNIGATKSSGKTYRDLDAALVVT